MMEQEVNNVPEAEATNANQVGTFNMAHFTLTQLLEHEIGQYSENTNQRRQTCDITKATDIKLENLLKANSNFCFKNIRFAATPEIDVTTEDGSKIDSLNGSDEIDKNEDFAMDSLEENSNQNGEDEAALNLVPPKSPQNDHIHKCDTCAYETKFKLALEHHLNIHKPASERIYKCGYCSHVSKTKSLLKSHILESHRLEIKKSDGIMHKCSKCSYETQRICHLKMHMVLHKKPAETQMYKCEECPFQTKRKDTLKLHLLNHKDAEGDDLIRCSFCSYKVKHKRYLNMHMLLHKKHLNRHSVSAASSKS